MSDERKDQSEIAEQLGHEPIEADARSIAFSAIVLVGVIVASLLVMGGLVAIFTSYYSGETTSTAADAPLSPRTGLPDLDPNQKVQLRELRTQELEMLTGYGWVDQGTGIARIPIARAMELLSQPQQQTPPQP